MTFAIHRRAFGPVLPSEAEKMKSAHADGETLARIAARFGRSKGTVSKIVSGKKYHRTARPARCAPTAPAVSLARLAHITAEPWSRAWFEQQNEAFASAWRTAFGSDVSFGDYAETLNPHTLAE